MSSLPGYTLERFLMWNYDLVVDDDANANPSLRIAEALGTGASRRMVITAEQFAPIVALFEPHREYVERRLADFDEENQSWRDYAGYNFDDIPRALYEQGAELLPKQQ